MSNPAAAAHTSGCTCLSQVVAQLSTVSKQECSNEVSTQLLLLHTQAAVHQVKEGDFHQLMYSHLYVQQRQLG